MSDSSSESEESSITPFLKEALDDPSQTSLDDWLKTTNFCSLVESYHLPSLDDPCALDYSELLEQSTLHGWVARLKERSRDGGELEEDEEEGFEGSEAFKGEEFVEATLAPFPWLPVELVCLVVSFCSPLDARDFRLAGSTMDEICRPRAFGVLEVSCLEALAKLPCMAQSDRIAPLVRELDVSLDTREELDGCNFFDHAPLLTLSISLFTNLSAFSFQNSRGPTPPIPRHVFLAYFSHPSLETFEYDGWEGCFLDPSIHLFRRTRLQPIRVPSVQYRRANRRGLPHPREFFRVLSSFTRATFIAIQSIELALHPDVIETDSPLPYLVNAYLPHLETLKLDSICQTPLPTEVTTGPWLSTALAHLPSLQRLVISSHEEHCHEPNVFLPIAGLAQVPGFEGFSTVVNKHWAEWLAYGIDKLVLTFTRRAKGTGSRQLLGFEVDLFQADPRIGVLAKRFIRSFGDAFPSLERLRILGVHIRSPIGSPYSSTAQALFPLSGFPNLRHVVFQTPSYWLHRSHPSTKSRICIKTYVESSRTLQENILYFPDEEDNSRVELEHLETDELLHPHRKAGEVLVGLNERTEWDVLARTNGKLETVEWRLMDDTEEVEVAHLRWTVRRRKGEDGSPSVRLVEEHLILDQDALCSCQAHIEMFYPDYNPPGVPLFELDEPDFPPAYILDSFLLDPPARPPLPVYPSAISVL